jgi:CHAT domain-containing protein
MRVSDIRLGAILYAANADAISGLYRSPDGNTTSFDVGATNDLLPKIDELRGELAHAMSVASGDVPKLQAFTNDWGRRFIPEHFDPTAVDALVIVPHNMTHYLPIHLVRLAAQEGCLGGIVALTYCSSRSLLQRCISRNPARAQDLTSWHFGEPDAPQRQCAPQSILAGGCDIVAGQDDTFTSICRELSSLFPGEQVVFGDQGIPYNRNSAKAAFRRKSVSDVVLVMAHGFIDRRHHQFSGLLLWRDTMGIGARTIPVQGDRYFDFRDLPLRRFPDEIRTSAPADVFTAAELEIDAPLETQLVALLGCSAGFGRVRQGDEPASLAETFLHVGAPSVIAPQWDSDIDAAREWTLHFMTCWVRDGLPKAFAAREAFRQTEATLSGHPEKFGVMALRGDWL